MVNVDNVSLLGCLQPVEEKKPKYVVRPATSLKSKFLEEQEARAAAEEVGLHLG